MARFNSGWVKLHRDVLDKDINQNMILWAIWTQLLVMASWQESKILWEGEQKTIPPGSVLFGIKEISSRWAISRSVLTKWLNYLHDTERVVLTTSPRGSLVTICNWSLYQVLETDECEQRANNEASTRHQRVNNEALIKNIRKEERRRRTSVTSLPRLAAIWNELAAKELPRIREVEQSGKRGKACLARWTAHPDEDFWKSVISKINCNQALLGANERRWKADFDWLCQPDTANKILEGKYDSWGNGVTKLPMSDDQLKTKPGFFYSEQGEL